MADLPPQYRTVLRVPPEPWPDIPPGFVFGPEWEEPGVTYLFDEASYLHRAAEHGHTLAWLLDHLAGFSRLIDGSATWRQPVRFARVQLHATLGTQEEIIHSLGYRPTNEAMVVTPQVLDDLATAVEAKTHDFVAGLAQTNFLSSELKYDSIAVSYQEQTEGTGKDGKGGNLHTLVPTIVHPFTTPATGANGGNCLPFEVAMCLTLNTDTRGPSFRGRTYIGGLASTVMAAHGLFDAAAIQAVGVQFGLHLVQGIHDDTTWRLNVVSKRLASGREVQGVQVGVVPDAQRRRRNALVENAVQTWGTPPNRIPVS